MPITPPTVEELRLLAETAIQDEDPTLTDFSPGSDLAAIRDAAALMADETVAYALRKFQNSFPTTASPDALPDLALGMYGLAELPATKSVGTIYWTEGSASNYTIPAGTTLTGTAPDGSTFQAVTLAEASSADAGGIRVEASVAGKAGNVPRNTLTGISGFPLDPTATISQPSRMSGGSDDEDMEHLRQRLLLYFPSLGKGTKAAVDLAALTTNGVAYVARKRVATRLGNVLRFWVADESGGGNEALAEKVSEALEAVVAEGANHVVTYAQITNPTLQVTVWIPPNEDKVRTQTRVAGVILDAANATGINEAWVESYLVGKAHAASPLVRRAQVKANGAAFEKLTPPEGHTLRLRTSPADLSVTVLEYTPDGA